MPVDRVFLEIRRRVLERALRGATLAALPVYLYFVIRFVASARMTDLAALSVAYAVAVALTLAPIGYEARSRGLVAALAGVGLFVLVRQGYSPGAMVVGCAAIVAAVVFRGVRESAFLFAVWAAAIVYVGTATRGGILGLPEEALLSQVYPQRWLAVLLLQVALLPVILATHAILKQLRQELTEKRAALEALEKAQASMLEGERLRTLGLLAGGAAHDLNNTLTVIACEAGTMGSASAESRETILEAASSAAALTRQMLNVAGRSVVQVGPVSLQALLPPTLNFLRHVLQPNFRIVFAGDLRGGGVMADSALLQQAVFNLVLNARDAMPGGGTIEVSVNRALGEDAGCFVVLAVTDTGVGMTPEVRARAFEPFFTTKANVRKTVESAGGRVVLESSPGRGTRVELWLPEVQPQVPAQLAAVRDRGEKALLIESPDQ
jgi:signal transduction histidine kinase